MANVFDQFDEQSSSNPPQGGNVAPVQQAPQVSASAANPFDQFDQAATQPQPQQPAMSVDQATQLIVNPQQQQQPQQTIAGLDQEVANAAGFGASRNAFTDAFNRAGTLGFGDEVSAGVRAGVSALYSNIIGDGSVEFTDEYRKNKDVSDAKQAKQKELYPNATLAGEIAGSTATAITAPVARAFQGVGLGARAGNVALTEGALGGLTGAGESQADTVQGVAIDAAQGAGLGATFGVLGEGVGAAITKLAKLPVISNILAGTPEKQARNILRTTVRQNLEEQGIEITEDVVNQATEQLMELNKQTSGGATLADADIFQDAARSTNKLVRPSQEIQEQLATRQAGLYDQAVTAANPAVSAGDTVAGRTITEADIRPNAGAAEAPVPFSEGQGVVSPRRFGNNARVEANAESAQFYDRAYATEFDIDNIKDLRESPTFERFYKRGLKNAKDNQVASKIEGEPSTFQVLDETKRQLDDQIKSPQTGNATKRTLRNMRAELVSQLDEASPDYAQARQLSAKGQQVSANVEAGQGIFTAKGDDLDDILTSAQADPTVRQELLIGAQDTLRTNIEKGVRDKGGSLLPEADIRRYNRLLNDDPNISDLSGILDADKLAARTAKIADAKGSAGGVFNKFDNIFNSKTATALDVSSMASIAMFATDPTMIGLMYATTRLGYAAASKRSPKQLAKAAQQQLYKAGATKADVENILIGDFDKVPADRMADIAKFLTKVTGRQAARATATKK